MPGSVVHVAESFSSGVRAAITEYARSTPELAHHLIYARRADAPLFPHELEPFDSTTEMVPGHLARVRQIRRVLRQHPGAVLHAHSSFGGVYARLAVSRRRRTIAYSPHCFAFERRDLPVVATWVYRLAERVLSHNTTTFVVCSPRELDLTRALGGAKGAVFAPNIAPEDHVVEAPSVTAPPRHVVIGSGRTSRQKDPAYFAAAVTAARDAGLEVEAVWAGGDGVPELDELLRDAGVEVTGWVTQEEVAKRLAQATVYLHTAAWEGFPISVLEAAAAGLPIVVRDAPCFDGWGFPRVLTEPAQFADALRELGSDPRDLAFPGELLARCSRDRQREALLKAYRG